MCRQARDTPPASRLWPLLVLLLVGYLLFFHEVGLRYIKLGQSATTLSGAHSAEDKRGYVLNDKHYVPPSTWNVDSLFFASDSRPYLPGSRFRGDNPHRLRRVDEQISIYKTRFHGGYSDAVPGHTVS